MIPEECEHCGMLVSRDVEGRLFATHPADRTPWTCAGSPVGHSIKGETRGYKDLL